MVIKVLLMYIASRVVGVAELGFYKYCSMEEPRGCVVPEAHSLY